MITMDVKGINWVGNIYQKFENMCLEAEDMIYEDTVEYIENQMQTVGASVKKLYSDIVGDLLPSISFDLDDKEDSDAGFSKQPIQIFKEKPAKANIKQMIKNSRIDRNDDNDILHKTSASFMSSSRSYVKKSNIISHSRKYGGSMDIKSNLRMNENPVRSNNIQKNLTPVNENISETKIFNEITSAEPDTCRPSQCSEISNEDQNQNHGSSVSNPASVEVAKVSPKADHRNEIENTCTEQFPYVPVQVKSAVEKQIGTSSSCGQFGEPDGFAMDGTIQYADSSNSMVVLSHPEQGHTSSKEDYLKLEETCVMVTGADLELIPKEIGNLKANKKKRRQGFSLSKKSARKQEYEELAMWHGNSEKVKEVLVKNLDQTLHEDQKKLLLPSVSETEWEFL